MSEKAWEEHLQKAIEAGYNPEHDPVARKARDKALSKVAQLEAELDSTSQQLESYKAAAKAAKETADTLRKELDDAKAAGADVVGMKAELEKLRQYQAEQAKKTEDELNALVATWEEMKPGASKAIPGFETPAERLRWAKENAMFFDLPSTPKTMDAEATDEKSGTGDSNTERKAPPTGQPTSPKTFPQDVKDYARRANIPEASAQRIMQKIRKKKEKTE